MRDLIVIGGGISGLTIAWRAAEAGQDVRLLESSQRAGGLISSQRQAEGLLELGPDSLLVGRAPVRALLDDLGLSDQMVSPFPSRPWLARAGRLWPLPEGFRSVAPTRLLPFVRTPLLSWAGKLRMLWDFVLPASRASDQTLAELIGRRFGQEVLRQLAQPLIGGIYAADPRYLSLAATMPHLLKLEQEHGSLIKGLWKTSAAPPEMASLPNGLGQVVSTLAQKLGTRLQTGASVSALVGIPGGWQVKAADGVHEARQVVVATSARHCSEIMGGLDPLMGRLIGDIVCRDVAVINQIYRVEQLTAPPRDCQGFLLPVNEGSLFSAISLTHQKWPGRMGPGYINLRMHLGGAGREHALQQDDGALIEQTTAEMKRWLEIGGQPLSSQLSRYPRAMPEYRLGHLGRIEELEARVSAMRGLHLTGNWMSGVGISECVARAERLIPTLLLPQVLTI